MEKLRSRFRNHPLGIYAQVWAALTLIVFGVFSYLSITGCAGYADLDNECGQSTGGSNYTATGWVSKTNGNAAINYGAL
jgi:hypothetical protein